MNIAREAEAYLASTEISEIMLQVMIRAYKAGEQGVDPRDFMDREDAFLRYSADKIIRVCGEFLKE